ncbi:MAG: type I phosphomannose isomerase catalytic subunit [Chloroflexota bacterium]|nr:type I phosphomannose isomerase catalytic subunit [Chloroflexota bacterium]
MDLIPYPLLMQPAFHSRVWGGRKLTALLNKSLPDDGTPYGESWEIHDSATIANGAYAGRTLGDVACAFGADMLGAGVDPALGVPLLAKFLDAEAWLSVQVHPNDAQAGQLEGEPRGKTEAWIVLHAEAGAQLVIGVQPGTDAAAMAHAIRADRLSDILVYQTVTRGDVLFMPANTIHALGPGIVIYEIQQSSDITYRLHDWGRVGLDGQPRALHIDKGVAVSNTAALPTITHIDWDTPGDYGVIESEFFNTTLHSLPADGDGHASGATLQTEGRPHLLSCIEGVVVIETERRFTLPKGQSAFLPAALGAYTIKAGTDGAKLLRAW